MQTIAIILGLLLLCAGALYLESLFVVWVLGLFGVALSLLQGFGIVVGLYFIAGFFKVRNKRN